MSGPSDPAPASAAAGRIEALQRGLIVVLVFVVTLALFPYTPDAAIDLKVLAYQIGAFAALALWAFTPRRARSVRAGLSALPLLLAVFLALQLAATLVSPNVGLSLVRGALRWAALFVLCIAVSDVFDTPRRVRGLMAAICIAVSLTSLYGLVQYKGLDPFPWDAADSALRTAPATYGNPNLASHALAPTLVLACGLLAYRRTRWVVLCLPLFVGHFVLTQTRGSLLGLSGALALVSVAWLVSRRVKRPVRAAAVTFAVLVVATVAGIVGVAAVSTAVSGGPWPDDGNVTLRYHSFYGACRMIEDAPVLGQGPAMYAALNPAYWTPVEQERFRNMSRMNFRVHNEPLEMGVDAGLGGAAAYVAVLLLGMYYGLLIAFTSVESERRTLGFTLAGFFVAFLLDGLFGFNVRVPVSGLFLFLIAGATAGLWREGHGPVPRSRPAQHPGGLAWRLALLALAAVIPVLGVRDFAAQFHHQRGLGAVAHEAHAAAEKEFRKAAALAPYNGMHHYQIGLAALKMDRPQEAAALFARTLRLAPNYIGAHVKAAEALVNIAASTSAETGEPALAAALHHAQEAARLNPLLPEVQDILGRTAYLQAQWLSAAGHGDAGPLWREAETHLLQAVESGAAEKHKLYHLVALARLERHDAVGARKALARSVVAKPDDAESWRLFLQVSRNTGRYDDLLAAVDRRLEALGGTQPGDAGMLEAVRAQVIYAGFGDRPAAEAAFVRAIDRAPDRFEVWAAYGEFADATGQSDTFRTALLDAVEKRRATPSGPPPVLQALAAAYGPGEADVAGAADLLLEALPEDPPSGACAWAAGLVAQRVRAVMPDPATAAASLLKLARVHVACRSYEPALACLEQALPHLAEPEILEGLTLQAAAFTQTRQYEAAADAWKRAAAANPTDFDTRYAYAKALIQAGQAPRARLEYLTLLSGFRLDEATRKTLQQELEALVGSVGSVGSD